MAICPSTVPPPQKVFPNWPKVLILLSRVVKFKKEKWLLDGGQQLSGSSWVDTVAGKILGPEKNQQQVRVKESTMEVLA